MTGRATRLKNTSHAPNRLDFAAGQGLLHTLDPRGKLLAAFCFTLVVALSRSFPALFIALVLALATLLAARPVWVWLLGRAAAVNLFVAFLWPFLLWRLEWQPEWGLSWNPHGATLAAMISLKVNAIFLVMVALLGTCSIGDLLHALAHLRLPPKLVTIFMLFYRYLHVIHQEYSRLVQAMRVRGFRRGNNFHTYKSYANLLGMVLIRSFDRADRVYMAMLCRGFVGQYWLLDHFHWSRRDLVFCLVFFTALIVVGLTGLGAISWT